MNAQTDLRTAGPALVPICSPERTAPTLSTKGPVPYQRLGNLYDVIKEIKQLVDTNNILNPGALY